MKKLIVFLALYISFGFKTYAEFEIDSQPKFSIAAETIKLTKSGILLGEYGFNSSSQPFNGLYLDNTGNLDFIPKILGSYKITDADEDSGNFYVTSYMVINNKQGLFKISKDFSQIENIGIKAAMRKVLSYKNKVYYGGYTHGCYVINKDGTNLTQILGDGYYGPFIDDIKSNSKNVYILSRGLLYKVDYDTNQKEQLVFSQRPAFIEVDDDRLYITTSNKFFYLSFDNKLSNEKQFPNNIVFLKKHNNLMIVVEKDSKNNYFWFSNDLGRNFYKSNTIVSASHLVKDIEIIGDKSYTIYLNVSNQGILRAKLNFDFQDKKIFNPPFSTFHDMELKDKITSFFDHRFPYLGNLNEPEEFKGSTLNFLGKELPQPYLYYSSHDGIDWGLPINTPIYSVYEGEATYFYQENGLGNAIMISHPNNYITIYGHLSNQDLITKGNEKVPVSSNQKIGRVGISGNTTGPHLHFTTYFGLKELNNKVDPFGWEAKFSDPWAYTGSNSFYLWNKKNQTTTTQLNTNNREKIQKDNLELDVSNLSFLTYPISLKIENTPPLYDMKNYNYFEGTSFQIEAFDFISNTIPESVLGTISFKGFKHGDDKNYSIWKVTSEKIDKQDTVFNLTNNNLSTIFEPNSQYLVLKDNFRKIKIKNISNVN